MNIRAFADELMKIAAEHQRWTMRDEGFPYFHGSPVQGLKELNPKSAKFHVEGSAKRHVFMTDDPAYAVSYGLKKTDPGWKHKTVYTDKGKRNVLSIPKEQEHLLDQPMSLYKIPAKDKSGKWLDSSSDKGALYNEVAVSKPVSVEEEQQFPSVRNALKLYGVDVELT